MSKTINFEDLESELFRAGYVAVSEEDKLIEEEARIEAELKDDERNGPTYLPLPTGQQMKAEAKAAWAARMAIGDQVRVKGEYLEASFKAKLAGEHPDDRELREFEERLGLRSPTQRKAPNPAYQRAADTATRLFINAPKGVLLSDLVDITSAVTFIGQAIRNGKIGKVEVEKWAAFRAIHNLGRQMLRLWALSEMTVDQAKEIDGYLEAYNLVVPQAYAFEVTQWNRDEEEFQPVSLSYLVEQRTPFDRRGEVDEVTLR